MYAELFRALSDDREFSRRRIAHDSGLYHSKLIRILDKGQNADFDDIVRIGKAVGADPMRAAIAVLLLKDPSAYFSQTIRIASELLTALTIDLSKLDERLFEGFVDQEISGLASLLLNAVKPALERRDRRITFL
jgi:hypothetical protein